MHICDTTGRYYGTIRRATADVRVTLNLSTSETKAMDRTLVHGLAGAGVVKWISQQLSWISTIEAVRILILKPSRRFIRASARHL